MALHDKQETRRFFLIKTSEPEWEEAVGERINQKPRNLHSSSHINRLMETKRDRPRGPEEKHRHF